MDIYFETDGVINLPLAHGFHHMSLFSLLFNNYEWKCNTYFI